jgi:UDP-N-acetylglucosamine 2-epimerase (non-hydrolysing)
VAVLKTLDEGDLERKAVVVLGTRPGIVMMSPIVRELESRGIPFRVLHTGQHYSENMDGRLFADLELRAPDHRVEGVAALPYHGAQTAVMLQGCEEFFLQERPRLVLVGGDANTNLAAALAARKLHIQVAHVEAGERSHDWRMPEEHNRVLIDHMSEYLLATNEKAAENLRADGVRGAIVVTGNPIVDATRQNLELALRDSHLLEQLDVEPHEYVVMTLHREENVDSEVHLREALTAAAELHEALGLTVLFAAHPRTEKRVREFRLEELARERPGLVTLPALGYLDFLGLLARASLVLTDSGGVQQEACILRVPCVTLRENTEWTETLEIGANALAGTDPARVVAAATEQLAGPHDWQAPFGDGYSAARIGEVVESALEGAVTGEVECVSAS